MGIETVDGIDCFFKQFDRVSPVFSSACLRIRDPTAGFDATRTGPDDSVVERLRKAGSCSPQSSPGALR